MIRQGILTTVFISFAMSGAHAASFSIIKDMDLRDSKVHVDTVTAEFAVNKAGSVWVKTLLTQEPFDADYPGSSETITTNLGELIFDRLSGEIRVNLQSGSVVCAHRVKRGWPFKVYVIEMTDLCKFDISFRDDGWVNWREKSIVLNIDLLVQESE